MKTTVASTSLASAISAHIRSLSPRAKTRTVDADEIFEALEAHDAALVANPGQHVRTRLVGGFVPNSYGHSADADRVEIDTAADGTTTFTASRAYAESRSFGKGDTLRVWLVTAGGAVKRVERVEQSATVAA